MSELNKVPHHVDEANAALDVVNNLAESFLNHWEDDEEDVEQLQACAARHRRDAALKILRNYISEYG